MRRIFISLVLLVLMLPTLAQAVPNVMSYQGKLNDKNGVPVSGSVTMTFTIYDAATNGNALWIETWIGARGNETYGNCYDFSCIAFSFLLSSKR